MFSKDESRQLREEFWTSFGKSFPTKWVLYNTKIKDFSFKFHFNTKTAFVSLDVEGDIENRITYWDKLTALKQIILNDFLPNAIFDETYLLDNGKEISRIYVPLNSKVSIHNKNSWQETMVFLNQTMQLFEAFFEDYKEVIKG